MRKLHYLLFYIAAVAVAVLVAAPPLSRAQAALDDQLRAVIQAQGITPLSAGPSQAAAKVALGRALFFDKLLSGNRDIACATCHHPTVGTADGQPLSIGTGGHGLGQQRRRGAGRPVIPRRAPDLFNRGLPGWRNMFWDSRVAQLDNGTFSSPAGGSLPQGLESVLAAQALFPLLSPEEMRGLPGDRDLFGRPNELALLDGDDAPAVWKGVMQRLLATPGYSDLFKQAYPELPADQLGIQHAANAIAAFEADAFTLLNSPWDRYVAGDDTALAEPAKRGALLFYGRARCGSCHSGNLFSDQQHHNIAVPQLGPGRGTAAPHDVGREERTGNSAERFAFRTPPLRNVAATGPYMHNGAYRTLDAVLRHYLNPAAALRHYDPAQNLPLALRSSVQQSQAQVDALLATLDPLVAQPLDLTPGDLDDLKAFLNALTDPAVENLGIVQPAEVPSGLPVAEDTRPVVIQDFAFVPNDLRISVGAVVRWTNRDAAPHIVVSKNTGQFSSPTLAKDQSFEQRFDSAGVYPYFCSIHPFMTGTITVQPEAQPIFLPLLSR